MAAFEVLTDMLKVRSRCRRPSNAHLWAEHLFQASVHFFLLNKLASISLGYALAHGGTKASILL